jgi:hypothetical protein
MPEMRNRYVVSKAEIQRDLHRIDSASLSSCPSFAQRDLYIQLDTLSRTNESLQTLLSQTEQDANLRGLEIDCLSEENDELRRRCAQLESRYIAERKQSFILEEELQRLRMMTLNHELQERLTSTGVSEGEA